MSAGGNGQATVGSDIPLPAAGTMVAIRYRRIDKPLSIYRQFVLDSRPEMIVTFQPRTPIDKPLVVDGFTILEPRSPVIWFTYPGTWHDIGLFHRTNGAFTGCYANILSPVDFIDRHLWETLDLCLDVWVPRHGPVQLLDQAKLDQAESAGLIEKSLVTRARTESTALLQASRTGAWPPPETREWSLARALRACHGM